VLAVVDHVLDCIDESEFSSCSCADVWDCFECFFGHIVEVCVRKRARWSWAFFDDLGHASVFGEEHAHPFGLFVAHVARAHHAIAIVLDDFLDVCGGKEVIACDEDEFVIANVRFCAQNGVRISSHFLLFCVVENDASVFVSEVFCDLLFFVVDDDCCAIDSDFFELVEQYLEHGLVVYEHHCFRDVLGDWA